MAVYNSCFAVAVCNSGVALAGGQILREKERKASARALPGHRGGSTKHPLLQAMQTTAQASATPTTKATGILGCSCVTRDKAGCSVHGKTFRTDDVLPQRAQQGGPLKAKQLRQAAPRAYSAVTAQRDPYSCIRSSHDLGLRQKSRKQHPPHSAFK